MYSKIDLAKDLRESLLKGFDISKVSKLAFDLYQAHGLEITDPVEKILLSLMAMEEGEEFEFTESEFIDLILEIESV